MKKKTKLLFPFRIANKTSYPYIQCFKTVKMSLYSLMIIMRFRYEQTKPIYPRYKTRVFQPENKENMNHLLIIYAYTFKAEITIMIYWIYY